MSKGKSVDVSGKLKDKIECKVCRRIFFQKCNFKNHLCIENAKQMSCSICLQTFPTKSSLKEHSSLHDRPFKCKICERSYAQSNNLKRHTYTHTGGKPHICEKCGKSFRIKSLLGAHLLSHERIENYKCLLCPKAFPTSYRLKLHKIVHEKSFTCDTCGSCFPQKSILIQHVQSHLRDKPNKCKACEKSFARKGQLNVHMITHMGGKLFKCKLCHQMFTQKASRSTHMKRDHYKYDSTSLEKCHVCAKQFMFKSRLEKHMKVHTGLGCLLCNRSIEECACSKNPGGNQANPLKNSLVKDSSVLEYETGSKRKATVKDEKESIELSDVIISKSDICISSDKYSTSFGCFKDSVEDTKRLGCLLCNKSTEECVCSKNLGDNQANLLKRPLTKDSLIFEYETSSEREPAIKDEKEFIELSDVIISKSDICISSDKDSKKFGCFNDCIEDTKSINTYQKASKLSTNVNESLSVKPVANVKEEECFITVDEPIVKYEKGFIDLTEMIILKKEPKEEYFEIDENSVESFIYVTAEIDEDSIKEESIEL